MALQLLGCEFIVHFPALFKMYCGFFKVPCIRLAEVGSKATVSQQLAKDRVTLTTLVSDPQQESDPGSAFARVS